MDSQQKKAKAKAKELMNLSAIIVKDIHGNVFPSKQKKAALMCARQMQEEHSYHTFNHRRWSFWARVEVELHEMKFGK